MSRVQRLVTMWTQTDLVAVTTWVGKPRSGSPHPPAEIAPRHIQSTGCGQVLCVFAGVTEIGNEQFLRVEVPGPSHRPRDLVPGRVDVVNGDIGDYDIKCRVGEGERGDIRRVQIDSIAEPFEICIRPVARCRCPTDSPAPPIHANGITGRQAAWSSTAPDRNPGRAGSCSRVAARRPGGRPRPRTCLPATYARRSGWRPARAARRPPPTPNGSVLPARCCPPLSRTGSPRGLERRRQKSHEVVSVSRPARCASLFSARGVQYPVRRDSIRVVRRTSYRQLGDAKMIGRLRP